MAKRICSRSKGKRFELEVAAALRDMGVEARRGRQFNGLEGDDVVSSLPWNIECKAVERLNLDQAYQQAVRDADGRTPVVIHKRKRKPIMITMALSDFEQAAREFLDEKP